MDLAAAASAKAAELSVAAGGGGNADSLYSAGVGLWNANKFPEAGSTFEAAIKVNPNHADSHFMLGKVNLNLGKLKEAARRIRDVSEAPADRQERGRGEDDVRSAQANVEIGLGS